MFQWIMEQSRESWGVAAPALSTNLGWSTRTTQQNGTYCVVDVDQIPKGSIPNSQ